MANVKTHAFKQLPLSQQLDTIAYSWGGSAAVCPLHVIGAHVSKDPDMVRRFLEEYYNHGESQLDDLLVLHAELLEDDYF